MDHKPDISPLASSDDKPPHRRRPRYGGKYPRHFEEKYKEHNPDRYPQTIRKVLDAGKTPAGTHRPIMVEEVLAALGPRPGETAVDCTLGYGGHAEALLMRILPGGRMVAIDQDPIELSKTEARLRSSGFGPEVLTCQRSNFAGLSGILARCGVAGVNMLVADLGVSSMQLDDPLRGFSTKHDGPLDMRMNPRRGQSAADLLKTIAPERLTRLLKENADEPFADLLGTSLAGHRFMTTRSLADAIHTLLHAKNRAESEPSIRRTFQALRIAVNDEFSALKELLRQAPGCLDPGGRIAILTFHSGEDRLVKTAFAEGARSGVYDDIAREVIRPTPGERHANPRSVAAKLRWARRSAHRDKALTPDVKP